MTAWNEGPDPAWLAHVSADDPESGSHARANDDEGDPNVLNIRETEAIFQPVPPIPWVCEHLRIAPGAPSMWGGYGYGGKTMTVQAIALAVASGKDVFGLFACRKGKVLHIDYEQGQALTDRRYQGLCRGMGLTKEDLAGNLRHACLPRLFLDTLGAEEVLKKAVDGHSLCVVDSFKASTPATEENDSAARTWLDMLMRVSEATQCAMLVIHHARKPSAQPGVSDDDDSRMSLRGSSGIYDALAELFMLKGKKGEATRVNHQKDRLTGKLHEDFFIRIESVANPDDKRDTDWGISVRHIDKEQEVVERERHSKRVAILLTPKLLDYLAGHPGSTAHEIAKGMSRRPQDVQVALAQCVEDGTAASEKDGRRVGYRRTL